VIRFAVVRLVRLALALLVSSLVVDGALYLAPGSALSALTGGRALPADQVAEIKAHYHLDDAFPVAYWRWLSEIVHGDFGQSLLLREPVATLVSARLGTTALLVAYAGILIVVAGIGLGLVGAVRGGWVDAFVVSSTGAIAAVPTFVAAVVLVTLFAVNLPWFPVFGSGTGLLDMIWHLTLPAIALALAAVGFCARVSRTAILDERGREHVDTARSRGRSETSILIRHILRNALVPITTAYGITIASLIAGSVVVENAFSLDGIGTLLIKAVQDHDLAVVQAVSLILVTAFVVVNTGVDLLYPILDPRIQLNRVE
jgi:peptide/nickel transport system permease protein